MSGITLLSAGSTGFKTTTLPSTLSFSGTGGGFYVWAYYVSNGGVTPTVRYGSNITTLINNSFQTTLGLFLNATSNGHGLGSRLGLTTVGTYVINTLPVQSSYSNSDIQNNQAGLLGTGQIGFGLSVIK
jgi:hypothetical protein